jgi:hypothetical protein
MDGGIREEAETITNWAVSGQSQSSGDVAKSSGIETQPADVPQLRAENNMSAHPQSVAELGDIFESEADEDEMVLSRDLLPSLYKGFKLNGYAARSSTLRTRVVFVGFFGAVHIWSALWAFILWNLRPGDDARVKQTFSILMNVLGVSVWIVSTHNKKHSVREDGRGAFDELVSMEVSAGRCSKRFEAIEAAMKKALTIFNPIKQAVFAGILWYTNISDIHWAFYIALVPLGTVVAVWTAIASGIGEANLLICNDQVEQCVKKIESIDLESGWDTLSVMDNIHHACHHSVKTCERTNVTKVIGFSTSLSMGMLLVYSTLMGHLGNNIFVRLVTLVVANVIVVYGFRTFMGAMLITSNSIKVFDAANGLRVRMAGAGDDVNEKHAARIENIMAYLSALNASQGPGFTMFGVIVTPRLVWGVCATVVSTVASLTISTSMEM